MLAYLRNTMFCKVEKIQYLQSRGNTKFAKLRKYNTGIAEMRKNNIYKVEKMQYLKSLENTIFTKLKNSIFAELRKYIIA